MLISEYPITEFRDFLKRNKSTFYNQYGKQICFTYLGRGAVYWAINILNLMDEDVVAVPAYHCGVEIEAILMNKVKVIYYKIKPNLQVDINDFEKKIKNKKTKAALVIHYYGFPQNIEELSKICKQYNVILIEDCAHSYLTRLDEKNLGTKGDLSIYSFHKVLPLTNGGGLRVNNGRIARINLDNPPVLSTSKIFIGRYLQYNESLVPIYRLYRLLRKNMSDRKRIKNKQPNVTGLEVTHGNVALAISKVMKYILINSDDSMVVNNRRRNFMTLSKEIKETRCIRKVFNELLDGVAPLCFPLRILSGKRNEFEKRLKKKGISCYVFGKKLHESLDFQKFPDAIAMSNDIIGIPVHQKIGETALSDIAHTINRLNM